MHSGVQLIAFNELLQKLVRQGKQEERFFDSFQLAFPRNGYDVT
jgi:hypothetical protein